MFNIIVMLVCLITYFIAAINTHSPTDLLSTFLETNGFFFNVDLLTLDYVACRLWCNILKLFLEATSTDPDELLQKIIHKTSIF